MKKKNTAFNDWFMLAFVMVGCGLWSYSHFQAAPVEQAVIPAPFAESLPIEQPVIDTTLPS
jgi:hypothetical protein